MEKTLHVINQMETDGVIGRYAIGGAVAAARYIEPMQTYDLHVLVIFPSTKSSLLLLSPIYDYLTQRGYLVPGETVAIEGWAVQFLPAYNQLVEEALERAVEVKYGVTPTRVLSPEYLAAIMVQTGRAKDHARLIQFYEDSVVNQRALEDIIQRHGLELKWNNFQAKYLSKGERMGKSYPDISSLLEAKERRRRELAALSWEEKVAIIEQMNRLLPKETWKQESSPIIFTSKS